MQNLNYENQGNNTYLVYEIGETDVVDSMSLGMLTNNRISGLAQTIFTQMDSKKFIKFNVSAKVSVSQFFAGAVNKKRLLGVFEGIVNAMLSAEDYMLDTNTVLLDMDYIFADVSTCETVLICLPVEGEKVEQKDLRSFFRDIMFNTQFDQTENCDHVAKLINYLNGTPGFSLTDFKKILEDIQNVPKVGPAAAVQQPKLAQPSRPAVTPPPAVQPQVSQPQAAQQAQPVQPMAAQQPAVQVPPVQAGGVKPPVPPVPMRPAMQVPPQAAKTSAGANTQIPQKGSEKEISFMYLMQHYNKDNAATYKAQKEAKKKAAVEAKNQAKGQKKQKKAGKNKSAAKPQPAQNGAPAGNFGFAVPGQPAQVSPQTPTPTPVPQPVSQPAVQPVQTPTPTPVPQPVPAPVQQPAPATPQQTFVPPQVPQGQAMNFGETTVLGGGAIGETTVLSAVQNPAQDVTPYLIRLKNNEKILLNKPVFRIGKEKSYVDYFIGDNTAISRSHANIVTREGEYMLIDTNSTNHTFVNGTMIPSNTATNISHGDKIRLANEEFEFRLY